MASLNMWLIAAAILLLGAIPCGIVMLSGSIMDSLVGLEMMNVLAVFVLILLAEGIGQPSFYDLGLALALLSFPSGLVFVHFMERWL